MLMPKRVKHRKQQRGRRKGVSKGATTIDFGDFGMQAVDACWITSRQIESARVAIQRIIHKDGKLWIRLFPDKPVTKKPAETRMGKGKGAPEYWVAVVKPGRIMFEIGGVDEATAHKAFTRASHKLPIKTRFVKREGE
ncbi:MAG: 50S ribosomal protein L16 [bacterium]